MNILYLSCHSVLEFDEVKLFTELGHNVFSIGGAYMNANSPQDIKRPGFPGYYNDHLISVALQYGKENLHQELIDWADAIMIMHKPEWILQNWQKIKHKRVIWRTIGQSVPPVEGSLALCRMEGLQIVRYSPTELRIPQYIGEDAIIRFYKDPEEFKGWTGEKQEVMTIVQSIIKRGVFCRFDLLDEATKGKPRVIYGPDNEDTGFSGGLISYEDMKKELREHRVYFYTGTYPASYTLGFIEAFMTGIPIVAICADMANAKIWETFSLYEVDNILAGGNGYCMETMSELKSKVDLLLNDWDHAQEISAHARSKAIELFGKETIKQQWEAFL